MEKYVSFKFLSVSAKRMIFSWFLQEPNEPFFILSVHAAPRCFLWLLYCVYIADGYAILAKLQTKGKEEITLGKSIFVSSYVHIFLLLMA